MQRLFAFVIHVGTFQTCSFQNNSVKSTTFPFLQNVNQEGEYWRISYWNLKCYLDIHFKIDDTSRQTEWIEKVVYWYIENT